MSLILITSAPSSDAEYRADLVSRYFDAAPGSKARRRLRKEAADYDRSNPGASLVDELLGASLGDVA
jgi:hypothetical protein